MGNAIETHELSRSFASGPALDGLSLVVEPGEVLALLGPNGAGKTTTVRLLNGVLSPDRGWSRVLGRDPVADGDEVRRHTGVLTENAGLDDRLTTRENLLFTARVRGFSPESAARRVDDLLERFGMEDRADDLTQGFSTGQRKRVALARALLHDPEVLFLDEPTSGLDPAGTRDVIDLIQSLAGEGRTIVLATHFLGEAGRLADRMAVLHHGHLRAFGRPDDLAAEMWQGIGAVMDLGGPATPEALAALAGVRGVTETEGSPEGAQFRVVDRDVLPHAVATMVELGVPVYEVASRAPSLEDVYFAIEARILAEHGAAATDGFLRPPSAGPADSTTSADAPATAP
ncbi:MAG TPA: ABC transporter ATP-binding protein [Acidimicrobiales bacterium]